jgi:SAM-dependent methyltransferase
MLNTILKYLEKPTLYEKGTSHYTEIWTDEHISKGMLEAHLHPDWDAATRPHHYVKEITEWVSHIAPIEKYPRLLDLGCGPGIYTELFCKKGYDVTGIDLSERSINYAIKSAEDKNMQIKYYLQDYLTIDFIEQFDIITLIYYDFGVFSPENRMKLLKLINSALKPGGLFIFDVYTPLHIKNHEENNSWEYTENSGFFSSEPYLCLNSFFLYNNKRTYCDRHIIIKEQCIQTINIWQNTFTKDDIVQELNIAGLSAINIFENMIGKTYLENSTEMCIVAKKEELNYDCN